MLLFALAVLPMSEWITNADYPPIALERGHAGLVRAEFMVDTSGRAYQCKVILSSGWPELDSTLCAKILQRGRMAPFTDDQGKPIAAMSHLGFRWVLPFGTPPAYKPQAPEAELAVTAMPADAKRPFAQVGCVVGADGKIENCSVIKGAGTGSATLDQAACNAFKGRIVPIVNDPAGNPTRYLRIIAVTFGTSNSAGLP